MKIFYHSRDQDGLCSGAVACWSHLRKTGGWPKMVGYDYGLPFPWGELHDLMPGEEVLMVDVMIQPFQEMVKLHDFVEENGGKFVWIDHHKSAIEDYQAHVAKKPDWEGVREIGRAACELTHSHYFGFTTPPHAVTLIGRYDVWDHKFSEEVLPFHAGMDSIPRLDEWHHSMDAVWVPLFKDMLWTDESPGHKVLSDGKAVLRAEGVRFGKLAEACAFETELDGHRVIAINQALTGSRVVDSVYREDRHDAKVVFAWLPKLGWKVSVYSSKPDVDASEIAKRHGGGGHKGAAGFQCDTLPFALEKSPAA